MGLFTPVIQQYLKTVDNYVTGDVLDVGCGGKPHRRIFTNVRRHIGMDWPSPEAYEVSKDTLDLMGSATHLPFPPQSFDTVLATQVIEHLPDPCAFLAEASRVLRGSGCLICAFPHISPIHEAPRDFLRYTQFAFRTLCARSGLEVIHLVEMGGGWLSVGYLSRHLLLKRARSARSAIAARGVTFLAENVYRFYGWLDRMDRQPSAPLNYLGVARRCGT